MGRFNKEIKQLLNSSLLKPLRKDQFDLIINNEFIDSYKSKGSIKIGELESCELYEIRTIINSVVYWVTVR